MNSENSRTSEYHVLLLRLAFKLDLRRDQKSVALSNLSIHDTWKNIKSFKTLKYLFKHGVMNLNYQMDHIQYEILKIIFSIFLKNSENVDNPSIKIYVNKLKMG